MIFLFIHYTAGAQWSVVIRRITEIFFSVIPITAILAGVLILVGSHELFEWTHADIVAKDPLLQKKTAYLNMNFFTIRLIIYILVWSLFSRFYLKTSLRHDATGDDRLLDKLKSFSPISIILFAITLTFASFDSDYVLRSTLVLHHFWGLYLRSIFNLLSGLADHCVARPSMCWLSSRSCDRRTFPRPWQIDVCLHVLFLGILCILTVHAYLGWHISPKKPFSTLIVGLVDGNTLA